MNTKPKVQTWKDKTLFTPGPLTTSWTIKQAMLRDLGSRDSELIEVVRDIRRRLLSNWQHRPHHDRRRPRAAGRHPRRAGRHGDRAPLTGSHKGLF